MDRGAEDPLTSPGQAAPPFWYWAGSAAARAASRTRRSHRRSYRRASADRAETIEDRLQVEAPPPAARPRAAIRRGPGWRNRETPRAACLRGSNRSNRWWDLGAEGDRGFASMSSRDRPAAHRRWRSRRRGGALRHRQALLPVAVAPAIATVRTSRVYARPGSGRQSEATPGRQRTTTSPPGRSARPRCPGRVANAPVPDGETIAGSAGDHRWRGRPRAAARSKRRRDMVGQAGRISHRAPGNRAPLTLITSPATSALRPRRSRHRCHGRDRRRAADLETPTPGSACRRIRPLKMLRAPPDNRSVAVAQSATVPGPAFARSGRRSRRRGGDHQRGETQPEPGQIGASTGLLTRGSRRRPAPRGGHRATAWRLLADIRRRPDRTAPAEQPAPARADRARRHGREGPALGEKEDVPNEAGRRTPPGWREHRPGEGPPK